MLSHPWPWIEQMFRNRPAQQRLQSLLISWDTLYLKKLLINYQFHILIIIYKSVMMGIKPCSYCVCSSTIVFDARLACRRLF